MNDFAATHLPEPELLFAYGQKAIDPRDGLALFGPYDKSTAGQPRGLSIGVVGTEGGIKRYEAWIKRLNGPVLNETDDKDILWPPFPGFEVSTGCVLPLQPTWKKEIDEANLRKKSLHADPYVRAMGVVDLYYEAIRIACQRDDDFQLIVCVVPEFVWKNCRPKSQIPVSDRVGRRIHKEEIKDIQRGQKLLLFDDINENAYKQSVDFRRQLKARVMEFKIPVQILRETTLDLQGSSGIGGGRSLTPLTNRAWNIATALYYKSGGKPWKLADARPGVCYLGLAFKRKEKDNNTACCAAQMFLDSGDGIVFMGEFGPWYSPESKSFHLTRAAAQNLLSGALRTYVQQDGEPLKEIFIHSRSEVSEEEFQGFQDACPAGIELKAVRIRSERLGMRMFRRGTRPVVRGTFVKITDKEGFLWTNGFKERLRTYDGSAVPIPLKITVLHGEANIVDVAKDILCLTKLNYNACRIGEGQPVTVKFSDAVGEILVNGEVKNPRPNFKFYI